ncbi:uncharacterized protein FOMMEDRAFT_20366 [Fomitiporia mediterranea MF3/22]|uniref:uncharacterized protein n=1 Tax=Fomitiporia mediterranea (strain MF3/22) TaxID=694068 RepID=UPI0004407C14|nr:uncharacterized protein FOMMEDRAFT_20366 [Fomitiporia mediterranea MF3/22]EJD03199.1 hypothetical protein FOMMEDRAFT_20366 [Fomitiporia mediterranea MF3/22]
MSAISPTTRRWMSPPPIYEAPVAREGTTLTPYLTLPYILSLTWLAYPIISVLFVAFRLAISSASAQDSVADAKANLLASCAAAEKAATVAASLPRYMAIGTNKQIADAVNGTMNAARATLVLSLTIVEGIINFMIDIYRSTFFCFLELVVRGGLSLLIEAVNDINNVLTGTFNTIRTGIQNDVQSINSAIQSAINKINDVNPLGDISAPQFNVPDLSALQNVTLPDSIQSSLTQLNSSLPTLDQLRDSIKDFVDTPFEDLKADINNTFAGLDFNSQTLFVPDQESMSFCGDMDTSVVDDLGRDLIKITKIGIVILVVLALLLLAAHCALEWYKWRCLQQHLEYTREAWVTDPTMNNAVQNGETPSLRMTNHNLLVLAGSQQHPLLIRISNQLAGLLRLSPSQHTNLQWFFHYVFHPPVLAVFLIGFLGLLSVELQLLAVHPIEAKYSERVASSVSDFSNTIATSINASMYNQSATYANQINTQVNTTQTTINDGLFGWVNGTTTTLNDTLVNFYSDVQNAVSTVFNGTVLESPIQEFVRCIIGTKIEALENALTFLHDNLNIDIPRMNESALVLSQADVNEASKPIANAAVGDGSDGNQGLVGKLVARYVDSLKKERLMFSVFIGLWGLVVVIAILIILWHSYVKPARDARKRRKFRNEHRDFTSFVTPYKPEEAPTYSTEKKLDEKTPQVEGFLNVNLRSPTARRSHEHQHQRSWDSLLDSSTGGSSNGAPAKISKPRKLTAIGSKAGRERFVSDEERVRMQNAAANSGEDDAKEQSGWMRRLTNAFRSRSSVESSSSDEADSLGGGSTRSSDGSGGKQLRQRPNLTIRTSLSNAAFANVARDRLPTAGEAPPTATPGTVRVQNNPPSAWSISPAPPRTLPWLPNPTSTAGKRPKGRGKGKLKFGGLPQSPRPTQRAANANVTSPSGFVGMNGSHDPSAIGAFPMPGTATTGLSQSGVPSYYHSSLPHHPQRDSLLPENTLVMSNGARRHKRTSSVPLPKIGSGPKSPAAAAGGNPFKTPFDDDARVIPENWPQPPSGPHPSMVHAQTPTTANPFSPKAM